MVLLFSVRIANLQREEQTVSMSISKWVAETEREPVVCVSFFYCLIEILEMYVAVLLT